jgi:cyclic pyranopterin phosphate synthase
MADKDSLSHLDPQGRARMVDVGDKSETHRWAIASAQVQMSTETFQVVKAGDLKKGDVRAVGELAGVMAAKRTADLIPLCHPLPLDNVVVEITFSEDLPGVEIKATARTHARTGVEMEALTAVSIAALTVYDMVKGVEKSARILDIHLREKGGGKSGLYEAD